MRKWLVGLLVALAACFALTGCQMPEMARVVEGFDLSMQNVERAAESQARALEKFVEVAETRAELEGARETQAPMDKIRELEGRLDTTRREMADRLLDSESQLAMAVNSAKDLKPRLEGLIDEVRERYATTRQGGQKVVEGVSTGQPLVATEGLAMLMAGLFGLGGLGYAGRRRQAKAVEKKNGE